MKTVQKRKLVGIVSPPYEEAQSGGGINKKGYDGRFGTDPNLKNRVYSNDTHNISNQNIGNLKDTNKIVGITSPPFEDMINVESDLEAREKRLKEAGYNKFGSIRTLGRVNFYGNMKYGSSQGQIGLLKSPESEESFDITQFHSCSDSLYWTGCYSSDTHFKKFIHPDTFAHPAKMSMILCDKIIKHLKKLGLLKRGDQICDFMSGTSRTGIMASLHGFDFVGVELEPHFIKMSEQNKEVLEKKIGRKVNWNLIKGDARKLTELIHTTVLPQSNIVTHNTSENLVGITSPPFLEQNKGTKDLTERTDGLAERLRKERPRTYNKTGAGSSSRKYGDSERQIGNLPDKNLVGITSPPFEDSEISLKDRHDKSANWIRNTTGQKHIEYGKGENLGNQQGESYLSAMLQVYQQASQLMPIIVTVTKNPTRKGKLRRLDIDTAKLLMACGYQIVDYHRALLFEEKKQKTLTGSIKKELKGRLSFFKRLSIQRGNVASQWEDVIIAVRR